MTASLKEKLERNIWVTRKCRINASERLLSTAKYIETLNVCYSIFVILLSMLSLKENNDQISFTGLTSSIVLTILIIYANATNFRERSSALKQNYINLQLLLDRLTNIEASDVDAIMEVDEKYAELLKTSENHIDMDMYKLKSSASDPDLTMTRKEKVLWRGYTAWNYLWKSVLIVAPIVVIICLYL
jgi:hypothetical protein